MQKVHSHKSADNSVQTSADRHLFSLSDRMKVPSTPPQKAYTSTPPSILPRITKAVSRLAMSAVMLPLPRWRPSLVGLLGTAYLLLITLYFLVILSIVISYAGCSYSAVIEQCVMPRYHPQNRLFSYYSMSQGVAFLLYHGNLPMVIFLLIKGLLYIMLVYSYI